MYEGILWHLIFMNKQYNALLDSIDDYNRGKVFDEKEQRRLLDAVKRRIEDFDKFEVLMKKLEKYLKKKYPKDIKITPTSFKN